MAVYLYDRQTEKEYMDASFYFRLDTFKHLYYCPSCTRSFDTKEKTDKCIFCNGKINIFTQKSMLNIKDNTSAENSSDRSQCISEEIHCRQLKELVFDRPSKLLSDAKLSDVIKGINIKNIEKEIIYFISILKSELSSKRS